jgi:hypothetical protein
MFSSIPAPLMALMMRFGFRGGHVGGQSGPFEGAGVQLATLETGDWKGDKKNKVIDSAPSVTKREPAEAANGRDLTYLQQRWDSDA